MIRQDAANSGAASPMQFAEEPKHILALAPNWLGDAAMCTPALRALKRRFPNAKLAVAARAGCAQLLAGLPCIDYLFPLPKRPGVISMARIAVQLRSHAHDLAVVFPHSFRAAWLAYFAGAQRRLGYDRGGRWMLLTDRVPPYMENGVITPIYTAMEYLSLIAPLGCTDDDAGLELAAAPGEVSKVKALLTGEGPLVAIAPGAAFGPSKRWPAERYAAVADALTRRAGARCVLITGPGEEDTREIILNTAKCPLLECQSTPPTLERLKAIISQVDLLVGNDSGPRHIAIAFKKPVICVMGSTSPRYTNSPWETGRVVRVDVDCGPCQKPVCTTDHRCMTLIAPEIVAQAALEFLPR
jgi:heptosyltransferase II